MHASGSMTSCNTRVLESAESVRLWRKELIASSVEKGSRPLLGFVPTMGALHEGHLALMREAKRRAERVIASIFVNPMQFGPNEDFGRYPRTFEKDLDLLCQEGVDAVFFPAVDEIYPEGKENCTTVHVPSKLGDVLEGEFRPGFFVGVATVVNKLFNIVRPELAIFGEKDYQQLLVIKRMVDDLNMPITICGVATVREKDGLALSSRNAYLSSEKRAVAPVLQETLRKVKNEAMSGKVSLQEALNDGRKRLAAIGGVSLQYLEARHAQTFEPAEGAALPLVILLAAHVGDEKMGTVRLIDNVVVSAAEQEAG